MKPSEPLVVISDLANELRWLWRLWLCSVFLFFFFFFCTGIGLRGSCRSGGSRTYARTNTVPHRRFCMSLVLFAIGIL